MRPHHTIALLLLLALVAGAAAAGEETPPAFPHEFYGSVTIDGVPAPAGTLITGVIGDTECGSIQVVEAGRYGDPDRRKGNRLLVEATSRQKGATITFLANGATAKETISFTPGAVTCLNLSFEGVVTAPVAAFSTNVTEGDAPLTVAFTDDSTGAAIWSWDFGDNATSDQRNPTHTYVTAGTYTVTLTVTNTAGSDSATQTITVTVPVGNIAVTSAPANAAIWLDGEKTGLATNTTLTNVPAGEHVITLKLDGYADASMPVTVTAGETATVHLDLTTPTGSLAVTSVPAGARVFIDGADTGKLTNTTIDGIGIGSHTVTLKKDGYVDAAAEIVIEEAKTTTLHLNLEEIITTGNLTVTSVPANATIFLDGAETGEVTNTTLTDIPTGEHTVTLTLNGYHNATQSVTVGAGETATLHFDLEKTVVIPVASFTAEPMTGYAPLTVAFTDTSTGAAAWSWDFSDGNTSTEQHPVHTYATAGTYTVTLTVTNEAGSNSTTKTVTVTEVLIPPAPVAAFTANVTSGVAPLTVVFTDTSTNSPTSWFWTFGDGSTSADQNPAHTYNQTGRFTVTLTVANAAGSSSMTGVIIVQEIPPQPPKAAENFTLASDAVNVTTGEGGQQVTFNATAGAGTTDGTDIFLQSGGLNVTIRTDGLINGTGTVRNVSLASSTPVNAPVGTGNVSVSFTAEMNNYNPALGITTSIYEQPSPEAREAFILAAQDEGSEITGIAYAVYFTKTNLTGDDEIRNATLRLTVSPEWVAANGGAEAIRIFRRGDDGSHQVLETTYVGIENGMMVFTAVSPDGFSAFALGAMAGPAPAPAPSRNSGGGGGSSTSVGAAGNLKAGDRVVLALDRTAISAVTFTAKNEVSDVMVTMAKGSLPRDAKAPTGTVYQYIEATLYRAAAEDFSSIQFRFAVPANWLAAQGCTKDEVRLFRLTDDGWREVPVEALGEENGNAIFTASPEGFSLFAITATGKAPGVEEPTLEPIETETTPPADVTTPPGDTTPTTPQPTPLPVWVAVLALGGSLLLVRRRT